MPIKAVVFDMDDTLFREEDYVFSGFRVIDLWIQAEYGIPDFYRVACGFFKSGIKKDVINKTLDELRIRHDSSLINRYVSIYRTHKPDIDLLPDARWVLDHISDSVKLGLISDGFLVSQVNKVKALKLEKRFDSIVLSDEMGRNCWKPSPAPYERICEELQAAPQECLYVGDNVTKDFITANRLGWTTVHISRRGAIYENAKVGPEYRAQYKIGNLKELCLIPKLKHLFTESSRYASSRKAVDL